MTKLLKALVESRRRWLIVTAVTFAIGLALLLPLADVYFAEQERKRELTDQLAAAKAAARDIGRLESRVAGETEEFEQFESRAVSDNNVTAFRSRLVELAHQTGCQLRRVSVAAVQTRPWHEQDDPLLDRVERKDNPETGLLLKRQTMTLSVSGSMNSLQALLEELHERQMLSHTKSLEMRPTGRNRKSVILDMELWFFDFEFQIGAAA